MPRNPATATALLLVVLCAACGGDSGGPSNGDSPQVTLTAGLQFSPSDLTIDPGTTVRWVSNTATAHTITPANASQPGVWARLSTSQSGTVLTHTFSVAGQVYSYFCEPHQATGMTGVIRVRD